MKEGGLASCTGTDYARLGDTREGLSLPVLVKMTTASVEDVLDHVMMWLGSVIRFIIAVKRLYKIQTETGVNVSDTLVSDI